MTYQDSTLLWVRGFQRHLKRAQDFFQLTRDAIIPNISAENPKFYERLVAKIDVVREAYLRNPSQFQLEKLLSALDGEVKDIIYDRKKKTFRSLSERDHGIVSLYLEALVQIYRHSTNVNRSVVFFCQRTIFDVFGFLLNSPDCRRYVRFPLGENEQITFTEYLYEIIEWQNTAPLTSGNLCAEAEWLSNLSSSYLNAYEIKPTAELLESTFSLLRWACENAIRNRPQALIGIFENVRSECTSIVVDEIYVYPRETIKWWDEWHAEYSKLEYSVYNIDNYFQAFSALQGSDVELDEKWEKFRRYASNNTPSFFTNYDTMEVIKLCIQHTAMSEIYVMFCLISRQEYWDVLKQIWYCSKPEHSDVDYCEIDFFSRNHNSLFAWFVGNFKDDLYFRRSIIGRDSFRVNAIRFLVVLYADFVYRNRDIKFEPAFSKVKDFEIATTIVQSMMDHVELIENEKVSSSFGWVNPHPVRLKIDCLANLKIMEAGFQNQMESKLARMVPDKIKHLRIINDLWRGTAERFCDLVNSTSWLNAKYSTSLKERFVCYPFCDRQSHCYLPDSSGYVPGLIFNADQLYHYVLGYFVDEVKLSAQGERTQKLPGSLWLVPSSMYKHAAQIRDRLSNICGFKVGKDDPVLRYGGDRIISVEKGSLVTWFFDWGDLPWREHDKPIPVFGYVDFNECAEGELHLYMSIQIIDKSKITDFGNGDESRSDVVIVE